MSSELRTTAQSGYTAGTIKATIRRLSDMKMRYSVTPAFETNNDAHVASYGVTLTDQGGDIYTADMPTDVGAGTYRITCYYVPGLTLLTTSDILDSYDIGWSGTAVTGSPSVGADQTTVGELRTILQTFSRFAGINTTFSNDPYILADADYAIQGTLNTLIDKSKCTTRTDTLSMLAAATTVDFSSLTGFGSRRILRIWAYPADGSTLCGRPDLDVIDMERIDAYRAKYGATTGHPGAIGFPLRDGTSNKTARAASVDYTVKVRHWATLSAWAAGDSGAGSTVINIPADIAREAVQMGGVMRLQGQEIQNLPITDRRRVDWNDLVARASAEASLGVLSSRRMNTEESRSERRERLW